MQGTHKSKKSSKYRCLKISNFSFVIDEKKKVHRLLRHTSMLFAPSRSTRAFFFHRPKSEETDRQERSPGSMTGCLLVRFSTTKQKPPQSVHRAAGPRSKKPYNCNLQVSLIRRDWKGGWTKRTNHSGHVPSVGHASGQAPCGRRENTLRQTLEYSAASTRVLSAKYAGGLRTPHRRETVRDARLCGRRNRQDMPMWKRVGSRRGNRTGQNNIPES